MLKVIGIFLFAVFGMKTIVECIRINKCENGGQVPLHVAVANCTRETPLCSIPFKAPLEIEMTFTTPRYLEKIKPQIKARTVLGNFSIPVSKKEENACFGIVNTFCPLSAKELIEYRLHVNMFLIPLVPASITFELFDEDLKQSVVCFQTVVYPHILSEDKS